MDLFAAQFQCHQFPSYITFTFPIRLPVVPLVISQYASAFHWSSSKSFKLDKTCWMPQCATWTMAFTGHIEQLQSTQFSFYLSFFLIRRILCFQHHGGLGLFFCFVLQRLAGRKLILCCRHASVMIATACMPVSLIKWITDELPPWMNDTSMMASFYAWSIMM